MCLSDFLLRHLNEKKKLVEIIASPHKFYGKQELIAFIELFLNFILIMNDEHL